MNSEALVHLSSWNPNDIRPLFASLSPQSLQVESALIGTTPCSLFVDSVESPTAAALAIEPVWAVVGNPRREFLRAINQRFSRDSYSVLHLDPSFTLGQHAVLFEDLYFVCARSRYAERTSSEPIRIPLPSPYALVPIDQDLLASNVEGVDDLRDSIIRDWRTQESYEAQGFGFAALLDQEIVSHSMTDYVCGDRCEIGVETSPEHRLKGLGAAVAARTANAVFDRGLRCVGWMSWATNLGSIAVSKRAGFIETHEYDVYINHWPAENPENLSTEAYRAFAEDYEQRFDEHPPVSSGYPYLVAATAWALAGKGQRCRDQLHRAIDIGWLKTMDQLRELWPELFLVPGILEAPRWSAILSRLARSTDSNDGVGS